MKKIFPFFFLLLFSSFTFAAYISGDLINDPDLPSANLYSAGGTTPANISASTDAILGEYSLRVQAGTILNGGGTYGGICKAMPSLTAGKIYTFIYWAKALNSTFSEYFSFQSGSGDQNNMSHAAPLSLEWREYSYTVLLNIAKPVFYAYPSAGGATILIDNIRVYEVSSDTPTGLFINNVP